VVIPLAYRLNDSASIRLNLAINYHRNADAAHAVASAVRTALRALDTASPFGFLAQPVDVGAAVVYLCSEGGRYVTNQRLAVNGGGFPGDVCSGDS
jgi:NAD(P)-dependent dehydrogenase (short-subunit alcohol dehydrogenase family)